MGTQRKMTACYLRVSTFDQQKGLDSQRRALKEYCHNHGMDHVKWYRDVLSGSTTQRPAFKRLQRHIFDGRVDTVVTWKLDRLSRSLKDGINVLCDWLERDVRVVAVTQQLDFSGATGQLVAAVLLAVAAMERENLRENTKRGIAAARARGVKLGKRPKLFSKDIVPMLKGGMTVMQVAEKLGKTPQGIYLALRRGGVKINEVWGAK